MNASRPAKPADLATLSISARIRADSWSPISWIWSGVSEVVVSCRTRKA
jgi:hypothetical protein